MNRIWLAPVLTMTASLALGQNAEVSGLILDPSHLGVGGAEVTIRNEKTGGRRTTKSNESGFYSLPTLNPSEYRLTIRATGFDTIVREGIMLEVGESARIDFTLRIGDSRTVVTVSGGPPLINTENASLGTVIDRDTIDQMPLNGRGIQTLIELSPGVVTVPVTVASPGQFAVNGQRSDANYFTVDGVSANFAVTTALSSNPSVAQGEGSIGPGSATIPANNFLGTFSNLVSPEALQEFQIQTSSFAPEFGRAPGAQISLVTRSGTNRYSGSLYEFLGNDKTDANDWFLNQQALPKPPLRFNDFGGVLGGPFWIPRLYDGRNRTFFFLSLEGTTLLEPQPVFSFAVPTLQARQDAMPSVAALLNIYPLPNRSYGPGGDPGFAYFAGSSSLPQAQRSFGLRLDHTFNDRLTAFVRYNQAPAAKQGIAQSTADIGKYSIATETLTFGLTHALSPNIVNEIRLNGSRQDGSQRYSVDSGAGAQTPQPSLLLPRGYSFADSNLDVILLPAPNVYIGLEATNATRQLQAVDNFSWSIGAHQLKFGLDYRWFSQELTAPRVFNVLLFLSLYGPTGAYNGNIYNGILAFENAPRTAFVLTALSAYAQDTWKAGRAITITYGLRWEVDPSPYVSAGQALILQGTSSTNPALTELVPNGKGFYPTSWKDFAPRLGVAWQLRDSTTRKTVFRVGAGRYFDLGQGYFEIPFGGGGTLGYVNQPLGSIPSGPATPSSPVGGAIVAAHDYQLPNTWEWNATLEQAIGQQTFSVGYVGAVGRHLLAWSYGPVNQYPGSSLLSQFISSDADSSYNAMQVQFNRRLSKRLHVLTSYTWSHSIDDLSNDQPTENILNIGVPSVDPRERGSSSFDVRHALNGSLIAALPSPHEGVAGMLFRNWSANTIFFARSALPIDLLADNFGHRPNLVPGQPLYLYGSAFPGGKSLNKAAFSVPPSGENGDLGRNVLRGFGAWQCDFALHREFRLSEKMFLQFRAEAFNVFNHPNFSDPSDPGFPGSVVLAPELPTGQPFGQSTQMLASGLSSTGVLNQLSPLFQIGGPRSLQFALRLQF